MLIALYAIAGLSRSARRTAKSCGRHAAAPKHAIEAFKASRKGRPNADIGGRPGRAIRHRKIQIRVRRSLIGDPSVPERLNGALEVERRNDPTDVNDAAPQ